MASRETNFDGYKDMRYPNGKNQAYDVSVSSYVSYGFHLFFLLNIGDGMEHAGRGSKLRPANSLKLEVFRHDFGSWEIGSVVNCIIKVYEILSTMGGGKYKHPIRRFLLPLSALSHMAPRT